ncbi:hypothetical protein AwDysgo_20920 [Bacteroidales bacterium]|nr:hypothetical protein AwDysgo_20920 [Bacteroidales bacterium]
MKKNILILLLFVFGSLTTAVKAEEKPKLMWLDCSANFERFSYPDSILYYVDKCHSVGITHLVLDLKGTTGMVLYPSKIATQKKTWKGHTRPDFDFVNSFLNAAHAKGMKVFASFNIFVDGHGYFRIGEIYEKHKKWQSINYIPGEGLVPTTEIENKATAFLNPALKEVQDYEISVLKEVVQNYKIDGIMLDRTRYDNIQSDFSEESKSMFEKYIGKEVKKFPNDIYEWVKTDNGSYNRQDGEHFKKWIEWRASIIYNFIKDTRSEIKAINPNCVLAAYTGAWYPSYYEVGVNWASKNYDPSKDFDWATPEYKNYAYAELLDFYTNGNYYWNVTLDEYYKSSGKYKNETDSDFSTGEHLCVEGGNKLSRRLLGNSLKFSGGIYVEDYKQDANQFKRAVEMNLKESDGLMIFDIVHIINKNWWEALEEAIKK